MGTDLVVVKPLRFFSFDQNNSGGGFVVDNDVAHNVIIEAATADEANAKAEDIGIYFNGCDDGSDCPCCGDRWYPVDESDGEDAPNIYGNDPELHDELFAEAGQPYCHVYYADGLVKTYRK